MPPVGHALLSASSASRWMACTAAPRFEEGFPAKSSIYAEAGTVAHAICEIYARQKFKLFGADDFVRSLNEQKANPLFDEEMLKTAEIYVNTLMDFYLAYEHEPYVVLESRVDLSEWIPDGFGTCDCVIIGNGNLRIVDYKHGVGVPVSATDNPQMRLYALGALHKYQDLFEISTVSTTIVQPRIKAEPDTETMTVDELLAWGETVRPLAQEAFSDAGKFVPGEAQCRFCRGASRCRARAEHLLALEAARNKALLTPLSNEEIADLLIKGADIVAWYGDLKAEALNAIMAGEEIPGWKVVAGRSDRQFVDADAAMNSLLAAGYDRAILYDYKPKTLAQLEKAIGKTEFAKIMEGQIIKPEGKPTLVDAADRREPLHRGADEFRGAV